MPLSRPTLRDLIDRAWADESSRIPGTRPEQPGSVLGALGRLHAGAVHGLYGHQAWLWRQLFAHTADDEVLRNVHAVLWQVTPHKPKQAGGAVEFSGTNDVTIPAGTTVQRADGTEYTTDAEVTVASGTATAWATAVEGGAAGNADAGTAVSLVSPIAGVQSQATCPSGMDGGADAETTASLRARVLEQVRKRAQGGSRANYETWAKAISGVGRVWVREHELGLGSVVVRFDTTDGGIPSAALVAEVQNYINERHNIGCVPTVRAPVAAPLNPDIRLTPDTADVRAAVEAELADLLRAEGAPGATIPLTHFAEAISRAAGETDHQLLSPSADVTYDVDELPTLGTPTWA